MKKILERTNTVVVGAGQAGLAISAHLNVKKIEHVIFEKGRVVERWRADRWDSLVANGPAWHDRFPVQEFINIGEDDFATRDEVINYFETFAKSIKAPVRCGIEVTAVERHEESGFLVKTTSGALLAENIVAATGPFQIPFIPNLIPKMRDLKQIHSSEYRNPKQLKDGSVLVVGAGSSGSQISEELLKFFTKL